MVVRESHDVQPLPPQPTQLSRASAPGKTKTNVVVRRQYFNWSDIESDNYLTYIANLKSIGCPPTTIRDIIVADVNQLFAHRAATEILTGDQEWWLSEPDPSVLEAAAAKSEALASERRQLLDNLLGPGWDTSVVNPTVIPSRFNGTVLGNVSPEAKQAVENLEADSTRRLNDYVQAQKTAGKPVDPAELAKLRLATRTELAKLLTPAQFEEYSLRYSVNAEALRTNLKGFEATQEEFRSIFHASDEINSQIDAFYSGDDPASVRKRAELEKMRDAAVQQALGPERYPVYKITQDPLFQEAQASAEQSGAPPEKVIPMYRINQLTQQEKQRISADRRLTAEQRAEALRTVDQQQQRSLRQILGDFSEPELPPTPPNIP